MASQAWAKPSRAKLAKVRKISSTSLAASVTSPLRAERPVKTAKARFNARVRSSRSRLSASSGRQEEGARARASGQARRACGTTASSAMPPASSPT